MQSVISFFAKFKEIRPIIGRIKDAGGTAYLVGGIVRDIVLDHPIKDADIEIHKLSVNTVEEILRSFGTVMLVGKKFGVFRLHHLDIDWSLPRRDSKGRKPEVAIDPDMDIAQACKRRDLTMNAMAIDLNYVYDHFDALCEKVMQPFNP